MTHRSCIPSLFGEKTFGIVTGFKIRTVTKSVAVHPNAPVAVRVYVWSALAVKDGFNADALLNPAAGVQLNVNDGELAVASNCIVVPWGTTNDRPASITGCR